MSPSAIVVDEAPQNPAGCQTGCGRLALERHEGPDGSVWLCGSCGMRARLSLRQEVVKEEIAAMCALPFERLAAFREGQRRRIYG
jgi:hypothetical protein